MSVDPLASKYPSWSPYNYTLNNPINNYDPDGNFVICGTIAAIYLVDIAISVAVTTQFEGSEPILNFKIDRFLG